MSTGTVYNVIEGMDPVTEVLAAASLLAGFLCPDQGDLDHVWKAAEGREHLLEAVDHLLSNTEPSQVEIATARVLLAALREQSRNLAGVEGLRLID